MPAVNPFFTFLSLVIQQTTRISTTFQKLIIQTHSYIHGFPPQQEFRAFWTL
jgi:hypothetical protein